MLITGKGRRTPERINPPCYPEKGAGTRGRKREEQLREVEGPEFLIQLDLPLPDLSIHSLSILLNIQFSRNSCTVEQQLIYTLSLLLIYNLVESHVL